jgi:Tol biopolymer transport system component
VIANADAPAGWMIYDRITGTKRPLWTGADAPPIRQVAWSNDGRSLVGILNGRDRVEIRTFAADGAAQTAHPAPAGVSYPAYTPRGEVACVVTESGRSHITVPCGGAAITTEPRLDIYGPIAFSPDGETIYGAAASEAGTLDLWRIPARGGAASQLTAFARDTYAPSVAADGTVFFKSQVYRTMLAAVAADGGAARPLTTFQSETPSWDPSSRWIGFTYGTWRRVVDDAHYPDIAQDVGIVPFDVERTASQPARVIHNSPSEDQGLCWSPNGRWIAFHSHKEQSDDIWLQPAEGGTATRVSFLGRGAETGWPRWSPDGGTVVFSATDPKTHRTNVYAFGVDQTSGDITRAPEIVPLRGFDAIASNAEWLPDGKRIAVLGRERPGQYVIVTAPASGGDAALVRRFASEHEFSGISVSPDGREIAFVAPAAGGFFQVFRTPIGGGEPRQVTNDASNKTQPAWSPDGRYIAFTVWTYDAQLWTLKPSR